MTLSAHFHSQFKIMSEIPKDYLRTAYASFLVHYSFYVRKLRALFKKQEILQKLNEDSIYVFSYIRSIFKVYNTTESLQLEYKSELLGKISNAFSFLSNECQLFFCH